MSVTIVLVLALLWLAANAALVLMLRRNARVRERRPGHAASPGVSRTQASFGRAGARL